MPSIIQRISLISFIFLSFLYSTSFSAFAQEYKVESFTVVQDDLSAKTNPKIDNNGKKCAMIKVYVDDRISAVRGNIFGEVTTLGMEKSFYFTDGSKKLELVFDTHYPLKIVFDDYNIPALTGGMTYVLKLKAEGGSSQSTTTTQTNNQTAQTNYQSTKQTNTFATPSSSSSSQSNVNSNTINQDHTYTYQADNYRTSVSNTDYGDLKTLMSNGKNAFGTYDKDLTKRMINSTSVDNIKMGMDLLNGYKNYVNAIPIASSQKATKDLKSMVKTLKGHVNDFYSSGADFFNKKYYPEAYECFMIFADMPDKEFMREEKLNLTAIDRGTAYFNAGLAAYAYNSLVESADAFRKARKIGYDDKQAYIYEIACWQNLMQNDPEMEESARELIMDVAQEGDRKFGMSEPLFFNNIINYYVNVADYNRAVASVNSRIAQNPGNADLYGLLGFVYDKMGKDNESVAEYRKAASLNGADFETLLNAAKKIYSVGSEKWNAIEGNTESARASRRSIKKEYLETAKKITERAKILKSENGDLNYLIERIDYALSLAD